MTRFLRPPSPAERSEGKGTQELLSAIPHGIARPLLVPLPSPFGLAGGDGKQRKRGASPC